MNTEEVIEYIEKIASKAEQLESKSPEIYGLMACAKEVLRVHVGNDSEFYNSVFSLDDKDPDGKALAGGIPRSRLQTRNELPDSDQAQDRGAVRLSKGFRLEYAAAARRLFDMSTCI